MKADEHNQQSKHSRYWLAGLIGVVIGVGLMLIQEGTKKTAPIKSNRGDEFYAWEETSDGRYRQVKKSYFMNQRVCESVIATLNEMSIKQPRSNWVLSHTTESTFECRPADRPPFLVEEIESPYSDEDQKVESVAHGEQQKLTATELFDLRTKCAACVTKVLQDHYPDWMPGIMFRLSNSHYDPNSGRCFVELKVGNNPKDPKFEAESYHQLFDGQTGKMLAETQIYKGGERTGVVNTILLPRTLASCFYP